MSDINLDFTVANNNINFTVQPNDITITPTDIQLDFYGGGLGVPGGTNQQLQYNNNGLLGGIANTAFNGANLTLGNVANIKITGGAANALLTTDGAGNLTWGNIAANANYANFAGTAYSVAGANVTGTVANANYAAYAGNVTLSSQPNITNVGTLLNLTVSGNSNVSNLTSNGTVNFSASGNVTLGTSSNVKLTGGTNGYFLQTDGTGNLTWAAGTGGGGNGSPGGANTQIQYNDSGNFGGNAGFTFDETSGNVALPNNVSITGNISNVVNITSTGNITAGNVIAPISLPYGIEQLNLITAQTGTYNFDLISNAIRYTTSNASANLTLNFRGNSTISANTLLANGQSITGTYVFKTGATPYGVTALQVDGSAQTIKWASNLVPLQVANTLTSYVFTIVKTSTTPTYDVLASATRYG
jgi:hypothetical protein